MFDFDFLPVAVGLGTFSLMMTGVAMAGSGFFGEEVAARAKKNLMNILLGVIIVAVSTSLMTSMFSGF